MKFSNIIWRMVLCLLMGFLSIQINLLWNSSGLDRFINSLLFLFFMAKIKIDNKAKGSEIIKAVVDRFNNIGRYEVPGTTLEKHESPGLHFYSGCIAGGHRIRIYVPTRVYDRKIAQILAYETSGGSNLPGEAEKLVAVERVKLKSMPRYDVPSNSLVLSRRDHRNVVKVARDLEAKLSKE